MVTNLATDVTEHLPVERRIDTVLKTTGSDDEHIVIIEAQRARDPDKRASWPYYLAYLHAKYRCPVTLLVTCHDPTVARWARTPIDIGPPAHTSMRVHPLVLGPDNVPAITDPAQAAGDIGYAVLSALLHATSDRAPGILEALADALGTVETTEAKHLAETTDAGLGDTAIRKLWRDLMTTQTHRYQSLLRQEWTDEGRAEGKASSLLRILEHRGITVDEQARERITGCTDSPTIDRWIDRAFDATGIDDLFA